MRTAEMDIEEVQNAINAAFSELPVPTPRTLIYRLSARDRSSGETFRRELAGKSWQSLTPEFLVSRWSAFGYLRPQAYRYYLPALLVGALQEFFDYSELRHAVVFDLRPSFWSLYCEGEDQDLLIRQSAFTEAQYYAVGAFLGLVLDRLPALRHLAAQALYWGWNRFDTPALQAAREYYYKLHNFSYPEPDDPEVADICREIRSAFAETPYPGDDKLGYDKLCSSEPWDEEAAENAVELRGLQWQSAHPELLARCYTALSFLSDAGFRYFLPAFLLADLLGYELGYESNADPVFQLTYGLYENTLDLTSFSVLARPEEIEMLSRSLEQQKEVDWREYRIRRLMSFSRDERKAIIHYLEYRAKDKYDAPRISQVLEGYWRPSVQ